MTLRFDFVCEFPLPNMLQRLEFLMLKLGETGLLGYLSADKLVKLLLNVDYCVPANGRALLQHWCDVQDPFKFYGDQNPEDICSLDVSSKTLTVLIASNIEHFSLNCFEIDLCFKTTAILTDQMSYRDISKIIENVRSKVLGSLRYLSLSNSPIIVLKSPIYF